MTTTRKPIHITARQRGAAAERTVYHLVQHDMGVWRARRVVARLTQAVAALTATKERTR
jgi:hypothetical protein